MFDDKYLVYSRARYSALFISSYFEFNELSLFHLRYYLPHSSTKWCVEASLPYVSFQPCLLVSRNPCITNIQKFFKL